MIARNNIFNIRAGGNWLGRTGSKRGFVEFETRAHAIRAWLVLMRTYRQKHRCRTIRKIVTRFAPPGENDTEQYIRYCVRHVTKDANATLGNALDYARLGVAMAQMETGTTLSTEDIFDVMLKYQIQIL